MRTTHTATPESIRLLDAQWNQWLDLLAQTVAFDGSALPDTLRRTFPDRADAVVRAIHDVAAHAINAIATSLSITGALKIPISAITPHFDFGGFNYSNAGEDHAIERARAFSPVALYHALSKDFPPERVRMRESTELANAIYRAFNLSSNTAMVRRSNAIVLTLPASSVGSDKGGFVYGSYCCERRYADILAPVRVLIGLLGLPGDLPQATALLSHTILKDRHHSRDRIVLSPDVALVLYKNKIEVLLSERGAAQLNAFLGEWATVIDAAA